jgi:hypothetical protein
MPKMKPRRKEPLYEALPSRKYERIPIKRVSGITIFDLVDDDIDNAPTKPCSACHGVTYWQRKTGGFTCMKCHPPYGTRENPEEGKEEWINSG